MPNQSRILSEEMIRRRKARRKRYRLLYKLEQGLEAPMFILSLIWILLFIFEISSGLTKAFEYVAIGIWITFILEFLLKLFLAEGKLLYLKRNIITLTALIIPAFRAFRLIQAIRILRASRIINTTKIVRAVTSTKRFVSEIREAQGPEPSPEMNVGVLISYSTSFSKDEILDFAKIIINNATPEMEEATGIKWNFHFTKASFLESDTPRRGTDFLDLATLRMGKGPFDAVVVFTDVALVSRKKRVEPGLSSPVARIVILSTHGLTLGEREQPVRELKSEVVTSNAVLLLLHLLGDLIGLKHKEALESDIMAPYSFSEKRTSNPSFTSRERKKLHQLSRGLPERELKGGNLLQALIFSILMAFRHPGKVIKPLLKTYPLLLPLSLPGFTTAAITPSFILVFTAEIWDVGVNLRNSTAVFFAIASILTASVYLVEVQSLFFPRNDKSVLTEHLAVANTVMFLTILFALLGLFLIVGLIMLFLQTVIFPEGLMQTWPTLLNHGEIGWEIQIRLAAFISSIGVITGALAGGFQNRSLINELALFHSKP